MRRNVLAEHGLILAEAAVGVLSSELLRPEAQVFVKRAAARARGGRRFFVDVLREDAAGQAKLSRVDWDSLGRPENHLGHAGALIDRVLAQLAAQR
jgi:adenylosuccinate lyase